jgi:NAD(P)-dependent dehydrogenase (short-subunit alcohol dehydrogenase family)
MGFVGSTSGHPAYHASKGAVRIYSKAAAVRYGPSGVRVNTVHPGYMPPMLNATNDEASFVTGTELVIDGGFIAQ